MRAVPGRLWPLVLALAFAPRAEAGILVQATLEDVPLRLEMGGDASKVLAVVDGGHRLVDLGEGAVWFLDGAARRVPVSGLGDGSTLKPYSLRRWSEGPMIAGHSTGYNVMQLGETICGEVLTSPWMMAFLKPVKLAIELLQRVEPRLRAKARQGCGRIPFDAFAKNGWPLMAGWKDAAVWRVETIAFDHYVDPARVRPPLLPPPAGGTR
ncbi:MAG: hypothetical protein KDG89_16880 [Geminicoccaceae bacterium]|nr:hypothetical protein [Geminicoccaceae bacterium]